MQSKFFIAVILLFALCLSADFNTTGSSAAAKNSDIYKRPPLNIRQGKYIKIKDELSLEDTELYDFNSIKENEDKVLRPIVLELEARYLRLDELNEIECRWYQRTCKKELKRDKAFLEDDIKELKRQVWQKKEYYKILYLNATTREQDQKLRQMIFNKTNGKMQLW